MSLQHLLLISNSKNRWSLRISSIPSQVHVILTDEELLAAAETQEEDEDQEEAEEVVPLAECFSREEQVKAFTVVMAALEEREKMDSEEVMLMLRRLRKTQA